MVRHIFVLNISSANFFNLSGLIDTEKHMQNEFDVLRKK